MTSIIGKLDSYQILANLLPGAFFVWMLKFLFGISMSSENIIESILVYYFVGFIINRISAIIIKPILKCKYFLFPKQKEYSDFIKAGKVDMKIAVLSEVNDCFRSFLTSVLMIPITYSLIHLHSSWGWFSMYWKWFVVMFLVALFFMAYRRQTAFICLRIEEAIGEEQKMG